MRKASFKKSFVLSAIALLAVSGFFVSKLVNADALGDPITGLDVPDNVLQIGETETRTATTTEDGASDWTSSASSTVATIDPVTGVVEAIAEGTTTIAYATSTSGLVNSIEITVYAAAAIDAPAVGTVQVGEGDVTPTSFTAAGAGETISWQSSDTGVATIIAGTGVITPVADGTTTISYEVEEDATGRIVVKGSLEITVLEEEEEATLVSIAITTPADVLTYEVGDNLDITGLVVTGTYSDDSTSTETVTVDDITGFDSSEPEDNQVLTITVGSQTTTYTVDITAIPVTAIGDITGTPQFGVELTAGALTPAEATVTYQWLTAGTAGGTYTEIDGATLNTYTPGVNDLAKYLKVRATGTGNYSGTVTSAATELGVATVPVTAIGDITGTPQFGVELTAGALTPAEATVTYQWQIATTADGTYADIVDATSSTYTPVATDVAKYLKVEATGTSGYSGTATSTATAVVAAKPITAIAAINGTVRVGRRLTAGALTPVSATATYQWKRSSSSGGTYTNISGATSSTYTLTSADKNKYIKVAATGTDSYSGTVTSSATSKVTSSSSSGGGSGTVRPSGSASIEQMQATVNSLIAQINALIAQAQAQGIQLTGTGTAGSGGAGSGIVLSAVVRPLFFGVSGDDVRVLQNFLISQNKGAAAIALKNHGTTNYFGPLTRAALAEFQASAGLPATGYFGPLTKAYLKTLGF